MHGEVCVKKTCQAKTIMSTTLYWCDECNVPIFEHTCPNCGKEGKYIATDIRPVFPEEKLLLALIQNKKDPLCYDNSSVWFGSGFYIVDGKKEKISISEINKWSLDKIRKIKEEYELYIGQIDVVQ